MLQFIVRQELVSESEAVANSKLVFAVIRRIHYIVLSRPSQKCEGLFVLKSDLNVVFMGISEILWTSGWKLKGLK